MDFKSKFETEEDEMMWNSDENMISFRHYPVRLAEEELATAMHKKILVTTINGTYANNHPEQIDYNPSKPSPNCEEIHKNEYIFTLEELIVFIRNTNDVAEYVTGIEFLTDAELLERTAKR